MDRKGDKRVQKYHGVSITRRWVIKWLKAENPGEPQPSTGFEQKWRRGPALLTVRPQPLWRQCAAEEAAMSRVPGLRGQGQSLKQSRPESSEIQESKGQRNTQVAKDFSPCRNPNSISSVLSCLHWLRPRTEAGTVSQMQSRKDPGVLERGGSSFSKDAMEPEATGMLASIMTDKFSQGLQN